MCSATPSVPASRWSWPPAAGPDRSWRSPPRAERPGRAAPPRRTDEHEPTGLRAYARSFRRPPARPWDARRCSPGCARAKRSTETEARALRDGFAGADAFWQMLWWGILARLPDRAPPNRLPGRARPGHRGHDRHRPDPALPGHDHRIAVRSAVRRRPCPPVRHPRHHPAARPRVHRRSGQTSTPGPPRCGPCMIAR
jgi:hypothetical protein